MYRTIRLIITTGRSVHEFLWAMLLITALGTSPIAIVIALAIPYGCTLAKVFSELLDEQDTSTKNTLVAQGGSNFSGWFFSTLPAAIPDMISYTLYRYECAIRSAAILGFVGIPTIGYHIQTAMGDSHTKEIWTLLYVLLGTIIIVERLSTYIRYILVTQHVSSKSPSVLSPSSLRKLRPKKTFLTLTALGFALFSIYSWNQGEPMVSDVSLEKRLVNLERFISKEITPYPVQQSGKWADAVPWVKDLWISKGLEAASSTLYIATAAMIIAYFAALLTLPLASKTLNSPTPFDINLGTSKFVLYFHKIKAAIIRGSYILSRAMPEFLLAFLLVQVFGPTPWPLILALAIHNFGIVGRLGGEMMDNSTLNEAKIQLAQGGSRIQSYLFASLPAFFNRFTLYFFYRWETCIRDATVLGVLASSSLGFLISDTKARDRYDETFFFILVGAAIVIIGDLISDFVRSRIRKS